MRLQWQRRLRVAMRALWFGNEVVLALAGFLALSLRHAGFPGRAARARWLQRSCRRALRVFSIDLRVSGPVPSAGLLVCNHVSYLDILVLAATAPCLFISKCEVKRWPVFGWFAARAGTVFLHRDKRTDVARVTREMNRVLDSGALVVLFPEGTTSDGQAVLPFKSSLLEPATGRRHALSAGFIEYGLADGNVADEVCYWRDMTLVPHLANLLGKRAVQARLCFTALPRACADRKQLARELHSEVVRLRNVGVTMGHVARRGADLQVSRFLV